MQQAILIFVMLTLASVLQSAPNPFAAGERPSEPLSPAQEKKSFHLEAGFRIQLFASEPQINKPMNMAFDARGRLWVTSTVEYPHPAKPGTKGRDTVKVLEDTNGGCWTDIHSSKYNKSHRYWPRDPISGEPWFYYWYWGKLYEGYLGGDEAKKLFHDPTCKATGSYWSDGRRGVHSYVDWSFNGVGRMFTNEGGNFDDKVTLSRPESALGRADIHCIDPGKTILFQSGYESMLDGNGDVSCFAFKHDSGALNPNNPRFDLKTRGNSETSLRELFRHGGKSAVIYADGHLEMNSVYDLKPYNYITEKEGLGKLRQKSSASV